MYIYLSSPIIYLSSPIIYLGSPIIYLSSPIDATAGIGDDLDVNAPLARVAEEPASGASHHDLAFKRDVGPAMPVPSGLGKLQVGLDARAQNPPPGFNRSFGVNTLECFNLRLPLANTV